MEIALAKMVTPTKLSNIRQPSGRLGTPNLAKRATNRLIKYPKEEVKATSPMKRGMSTRRIKN